MLRIRSLEGSAFPACDGIPNAPMVRLNRWPTGSCRKPDQFNSVRSNTRLLQLRKAAYLPASPGLGAQSSHRAFHRSQTTIEPSVLIASFPPCLLELRKQRRLVEMLCSQKLQGSLSICFQQCHQERSFLLREFNSGHRFSRLREKSDL